MISADRWPRWIVPVWQHRNISLGDYFGNDRPMAIFSSGLSKEWLWKKKKENFDE
jgi:hypothetical protein